MALLRIRLLGDPILRRKCKAVPKVTNEERLLIDDMIETMLDANGAGLAAPQVGVDKRIIVVRIGESRDDPGEPLALLNPAIARRSRERAPLVEGCLSIPSVQAEVERYQEVTVRGLSARGKRIEVTQRGLGAQALQHELDHLNGVLFLDRFVPDTLRFIRTSVNEEGEDEVVLVPTTTEEVHEFFRKRARMASPEPLEAAVYA